MMRSIAAASAALVVATTAAPPAARAATAPPTWDGLLKVDGAKADAAYLAPGADFRSYTKVMLDPPEVAFKKNYRRDINRDKIDIASWVTADDMTKMTNKVQEGFAKIFAESYQKAGYEVTTTPGPDVLRLRTGVIDLYVTAPDTMSAGRTTSYSREAGQATLVLEARDGETGALLGRAIDRKSTGDMGPYLRNSVTNTGEFEDLFRGWAKASVAALAELKARSPLPASAISAK